MDETDSGGQERTRAQLAADRPRGTRRELSSRASSFLLGAYAVPSRAWGGHLYLLGLRNASSAPWCVRPHSLGGRATAKGKDDMYALSLSEPPAPIPDASRGRCPGRHCSPSSVLRNGPRAQPASAPSTLGSKRLCVYSGWHGTWSLLGISGLKTPPGWQDLGRALARTVQSSPGEDPGPGAGEPRSLLSTRVLLPDEGLAAPPLGGRPC